MKYETHFTATIIKCEKKNDDYVIFLDNTLFYAEGGGQPSDRGTIAGVALSDVQNTPDGIAHVVPQPLEVGCLVECEIDFQRRFSFMQHHTAEHILSGLSAKLYGFKNVGFHIGRDYTTVDFNGELTLKQAGEIEYLVNRAVWDNIPVIEHIIQPEKETNYQYRSKRDIIGNTRIITIEDYDCCACCGTHVRYTGEIGLIKLTNVKRYKGGVRISILCGAYALEDYATKQQLVRNLCTDLSSTESDLSARISELVVRGERLSNELAQMRLRLFKQHIQNIEITSPLVWVIWEAAETKDIPVMATALAELAGDGMVLLPRDGDGYYTAIASSSGKAREIASQICAKYGGRGGGSQMLWQGNLERLPN